jgi:hypothetical protein
MSDATEVQWVDEVPEKRSLHKPPAYGYDVLDALRANPGKWAKLWTYDVKGSASSARTQLVKKGYEAEVRGGDLYARWPDKDQADEPTPIRRNPSARPKSGGLPYVCDDCGGDFSTPAGLKHHISRHHAA